MHINSKFFLLWAFTFSCLAIGACQTTDDNKPALMPIDKKATVQTINLYNNLHLNLGKHTIFGHQDDLAYGVNWKYEPNRSDIHDVVGEYPGVYGWDLGRIELGKPNNLDNVPFDKMRSFIKEGYNRGGVITISWHLNNPLNGLSSWDTATGTVTSILPGGTKHNLYKEWLDNVADFLQSLQADNGEMIPVIFRPFHEWNGDWFWWGKSQCSSEEFKSLFKFTVAYLRDTKNLHHLLYAFNPDYFASTEDYLDRYPGDEWVDVIGFDTYQRSEGNEAFIANVQKMLGMLQQMATARQKIPALTEFGYTQVPDSTWWTKVLVPALKGYNLSFALAWRNAGLKPDGITEYFVPFKGQQSAEDFKKMQQESNIIFSNQTKQLNLYSAPVN